MTKIRFYLSFLLVLAVIGCTKKEKAASDESQTESVKAYVPEVFNVSSQPDMAPNFSWKDRSDTQIDFNSFRGKVTLVNFWATWCGPCKKELPDLIALSKELAERDVVILGIATDRVTSDVAPFVTEHGIPYTVILSNEDLEEAFGNIRVVPTTFLINAEGKIVDTIIGSRSKEQFKKVILALLEK
jgi:thiol-disulfide isomerase/thioredoxin